MSSDRPSASDNSREPAPAPHGSQASNGQTAKPSLIYRPRSIVERLNFAEIFPKQQPVEVELGAGDGSFLAQYAALHPEHNFIGVERLLGRLRKIDRKGLRAGLSNLRGIRLEASYVTEFLLPHHSVRAFHIYFPDPWPKRRHHKHRLINAPFTELLHRALEIRGVVCIRTDDKNYFEQILAAFQANAGFAPIETPESLRSVRTDFERDFEARGVETLRAAYERISDLSKMGESRQS